MRQGIDSARARASLPGVVQHTVESLVKEARRLAGLGVPALVLFGVPADKDAEGSQAWAPDGIVQVALRHRSATSWATRWCSCADLCLDEYTDHGHCGVLDSAGRGRQRRHPRPVRAGWRWPRPRRGPTWSPLGDDGRPGGAPSAPRWTTKATARWASWPTPPSSPPPCTARSGTRST